MVTGGNKRIVVIKDIPSNFIEEAILILKSEPESSGRVESKPAAGRAKVDEEFLLKEAEMIISNYIRENRLQSAQNRNSRLLQMTAQKSRAVNIAINSALLGSAALLLFLLIRLF